MNCKIHNLEYEYNIVIGFEGEYCCPECKKELEIILGLRQNDKLLRIN